MTNRYAAPCTRCGLTVPPEQGDLKKVKGKWATTHVVCPTDEQVATEAAARKPTTLEPTAEQVDALALFATGRSFVIEAGAGCGKSATLQMMAESTGRSGAYMAFNRGIVEEMRQSAPVSLACKTVHGWAFAVEGRRFAHRLRAPRMTSTEIARLLRVDPYYVRYGTETKVLQPGFLAGQVMKALRTFCNSADSEPTTRHFAYIDGIDLPSGDGRRTYVQNDAVREALLPALRRGWEDWQNPQGQLRFEHDAYVKTWEQSSDGPVIPVDYIVTDEAQDLTGVMMAILRKNQARGVQVVAVGDASQVIYQWKGTVSVFGEEYADMWQGRTTLTTSFRFGQPIAEVANLLLDKAEANIRLIGNADRESTVGAGSCNALLTRTNAAAVEAMFLTMEQERSFHLVGGGKDVAAFAAGAEELQLSGRTNHPELACFTSWLQVTEYVANDPGGEELKLMVAMVERYGAERIRDALGRQSRIDTADLVISTTHKSKGLQFDRVRLASDFADPGTREDGKAEWRLLYVAATRAKFHLDHSACGPVWDLTNPPEEELEASVTSDQPSHVRPVLSGITDLMDRVEARS